MVNTKSKSKNLSVEVVKELPSNYRPTNCPILTPPTQSGGRRGYNLFVGTLPHSTTKEEVEILFSPFGVLQDTYLLKQEGKGKYRCGFVSFREYYSAAHAIAILNGFAVQPNHPPLCVRFANPPKAGGGSSADEVSQKSEGSMPDSPASSAASAAGLTATPASSASPSPCATELGLSRLVMLAKAAQLPSAPVTN
eukprot:Rhum_TRINITY_DN14668_c1_g1::Rhum_TRINITY_DN14668_c1_g1_i1::g.109253::m.109253